MHSQGTRSKADGMRGKMTEVVPDIPPFLLESNGSNGVSSWMKLARGVLRTAGKSEWL